MRKIYRNSLGAATAVFETTNPLHFQAIVYLGPMVAKRLALTVVAVGLICLVSLIAAVVALRLYDGAGRTKPLNTPTVILRVQALSQLVTVKYVLEKVVVLEDPKYLGGLIPLGQNRLILLAHGEVKAGVDLSQLTQADVTVTGRKIVLTLPPAVVTDASLVEHQTQVLDYKNGLLVPFNKALEQTARRQALTEITLAARQGGIESEAAESARKQLGGFLQSLGFAEVEVRVRR